MNNKTKVLFVLLLLAVTAMAQQDVTVTQFKNVSNATSSAGTSSGFAMEIGKSWHLLSVMALIISAAIVAIGYAIGIGFELPDLRAWAGSELVQIITNAIIMLVVLAAIAFIDVVVIGIVANSNLPLVCNPGESCLQKVSNAYLADYVTAASTSAKAVLVTNMKAAAAANRRYGGSCVSIYCLQAGFTTTAAGEKVLDQDRYAILFEYYSNLLGFMEAQKFFVGEIAFKMAPVVLAIGIVARSFFFTRKIGGLLMAAAIGTMFFFPGMYIFDWVTLDMTLNGDKIMDTGTSDCPAACTEVPPLAYYTITTGSITRAYFLNTTTDVARAFNYTDSVIADGILNGSRASAVGTAQKPEDMDPLDWTGSIGEVTYGKTIYSCYCNSDKTTCPYGSAGKCPAACRELPYSSTTPSCASLENQTYCANLPLQCKVLRYVPNAVSDPQYTQCPASCKVVPPLKSNCNSGKCLNSSFDCRIANRNNLAIRPTRQAGTTPAQIALCNNAKDCPASLTAESSCVYVMPETGRCDDLCPGCPAYCRMVGQVGGTHPAPVNLANLPEECKNVAGSALSTECTNCVTLHDSCAVNITFINAIAPVSPSTACSSCPVEKRLLSSDLAPDYTDGGCSMENCPADYRAILPMSTCEACLFTEDSYTYLPAIETRCSDLCTPPNNAPASSAGDYMNIGGGGLVGTPEIQDVAKLMLPIYILPLFNIVATLVFIKSLSGFLGGDIEIPGLSKVF